MHDKHLKEESNQDILISLMEMYGDMVLRVAFTYVKERQLAEDLSQEIFLKCYKSLDTFQNGSTYKTWLYRITVNYCKDYVRSRYFRHVFPQSLIKKESGLVEDSVVSGILKKEENAVLFNRVLNLSVKLREVIILYYYEELSISEIANVLSVKSSTVKTRLYRARESLRKYIEGGDVIEK
ncbi:sigma-70 family RNA polymerase sigma factor [Aquibacillus kalidii]|uniref:sigma-70 family RNA polymerase sigma factor n=1 Tax=Aquibacillus kalidii TaxID=2762597 RepID=UPI001646EC7D|nr:sigma-70 family RNA polymerase sigma factor [Aquibacillus kalidii]